MKCQQCRKKDFSILLKVLVCARIKTLKLCDDCAAKKGYSYQQIPPNACDYAEKIILQEYIPASRKKLSCPACGYTYSKFVSSGFLGCPLCYFYFAKQLKRICEKFNVYKYSCDDSFTDIKKIAAVFNTKRKSEMNEKIRICLHFGDFETARKLKKEIEMIENENI